MYGARLVKILWWVVLAAAPLWAQSLNVKSPTPLVAGENHGTVDTMVGSQFWIFHYQPGKATIHVSFNSMALFGNPQNATMQVVMRSPDGAQVYDTKSVTSSGKAAELNWPGEFSKAGAAILEFRPTGSTLVRGGGDYTVSITGPGANFAGAKAAGPEQIVGTYAVKVCAPDFDCQNDLAIRFGADGTVETTDGHKGTWKVFDPDALVYSVVIGKDRWSLKLIPGRGLFGTGDLAVPVFQAVRR